MKHSNQKYKKTRGDRRYDSIPDRILWDILKSGQVVGTEINLKVLTYNFFVISDGRV